MRKPDFLRIFPAVAAVLAVFLSGCKNSDAGTPSESLSVATDKGFVSDVYQVTTEDGGNVSTGETETQSETEPAETEKAPIKFTSQVNDLEGVTMEVTKADSSVITVEITNSTDSDILYGEDFGVQMLIDGEWQSLETAENTFFSSVSYPLEKDVPAEWSVDWQLVYGVPGPGTYRIVKMVIDSREGYAVNYFLAAEFSIE